MEIEKADLCGLPFLCVNSRSGNFSCRIKRYLMRSLDGITEEYRRLNVLNYEMECGNLFKMALLYQFAAS
jgi:uridine phosphorylase